MAAPPTNVGLAGRGPLAGMPAAAGSNARGPTTPPPGAAGMGAAGMGPIATLPMAGGAPLGAAGMSGSAGGAPAGTGTGGPCGSGTPTDGRPTTGPLACIVEQHNAARAKVMTTTPLPPVTWNAEIAKYAQEWTDMTCMSPMHRSNPTLNGMRLGENLYASFGSITPTMPGKEAVDGWAAEVACYTYGKFMSGDKCDMTCTTNMHSDGCGHYTQVVWRASTQIGCGVTTCGSGRMLQTEVICNYAPAGNFVGMLPY
jgi:pathogenesis-related protein 1